LRVQLRHKPRHFFFKRFAFVFGCFGADIAAGCENIAALRDLIGSCGFAESGNVGVLVNIRMWIAEWIVCAAPGVIGLRDALCFFVA
jgi:hypothetical protein